MTDNVHHLECWHLRQLRNDLQEVRDELRSLKYRLVSFGDQTIELQAGFLVLHTDLASLRNEVAGTHTRMDIIGDRLERVERSLMPGPYGRPPPGAA
ncbi:hypothetical protein [Eleftheria terrae]|uniref:hypothetical protein n=1 Tax=Eleftheria terrae TaxID=1597781 RepID=UPI00263B8B17|nr:hypothetical protein [Eleftheria terrae]WKB52213.1 hypothetical protein N7L95_20830 [Eleftheria terrae]